MLLFLSYADEDVEVAREIADRLRSEHVSVYAPREAVPSEVAPTDIEHAIQEADAFLALLSPDSLTSASCRRERELALNKDQHGADDGTDADFVRVLQIRDTPYHPAGPLRSQPWFDATGRTARGRVMNELADVFASGGAQTPPGDHPNGNGMVPRPSPDFANRARELDEVVRDGVANPHGERFWLLLAPPQHGKSWLLHKIAEDVPKSRPRWWRVTWVDVRELPQETAADADAVLRMMVGQPRASTGPVNAAGIAASIIGRSPGLLCLLDSAELLGDGTVYLLRQHLDAISREIGNLRPDAQLAVIAASRRDREWTGLRPARPPRIKRLSEFSVDVVTETLEKLARRHNRRMTSELHQHAVRIHQQSEGLPRLLTECLQWTARHWGELDLLEARDVFREVARPYVEGELLSTASLRGFGPVRSSQQLVSMRDALRVLCVFRLFTGSHLSGPASSGDLHDACRRADWSADELWDAVIGADLIYRSEQRATMTIDRPIARLLFRYWYPSADARTRANSEARDFLESFTAKLEGSVAADMLIQCVWHEAQASILHRQPAADVQSNLVGLASRLSRNLRPDGAFTIAFLRDFAAESLEKDQELWNALRDIPDLSPNLFNRVVNAVLYP
jgi:TIR domain